MLLRQHLILPVAPDRRAERGRDCPRRSRCLLDGWPRSSPSKMAGAVSVLLPQAMSMSSQAQSSKPSLNRHCKCVVLLLIYRNNRQFLISINLDAPLYKADQILFCATDRKYVAPNGQHFNTYAKAQAQWRSEGYAAGLHPKIRRRGRPPKHVPVNTNPDHKEGPAPRTLQQLLEWQRSIAATIGETEPHQRFYRAVGRAQRSILLVRAR